MNPKKPSRRKTNASKLEPIDWREFANDAVLNGNMSTLYRRPPSEDASAYASPEAMIEIEKRVTRSVPDPGVVQDRGPELGAARRKDKNAAPWLTGNSGQPGDVRPGVAGGQQLPGPGDAAQLGQVVQGVHTASRHVARSGDTRQMGYLDNSRYQRHGTGL